MEEPKRHLWWWKGQAIGSLRLIQALDPLVHYSFDDGFCDCYYCNEWDFINGLA